MKIEEELNSEPKHREINNSGHMSIEKNQCKDKAKSLIENDQKYVKKSYDLKEIKYHHK